MKHQSPHLDTLAPLQVLSPINMERRMRDAPRSPIFLRIKTLDQQHLIRRKPRLVEPPIR